MGGLFLDAGRFAISLFLHLSIFKADQGLCFNVHDFSDFYSRLALLGILISVSSLFIQRPW
jgi:hypothetical protein